MEPEIFRKFVFFKLQPGMVIRFEAGIAYVNINNLYLLKIYIYITLQN